MNNPLLTFILALFGVCFLFGMGYWVGVDSQEEEVSTLTFAVQKQYFENEKLFFELQRCEHNAGVMPHIFLRVNKDGS